MKKTENMMPAVLIRDEQDKQAAIFQINAVSPSFETPTMVYVGKWKETRTQRQNRYLWGWIYASIVKQLNESGKVIQCADGREMEWTAGLLHEAFKQYRELTPIETVKGEIKMHESTASMSKKRFSEFVDSIRRACYGWWKITIPEPVGIWIEYRNAVIQQS